MDFMTARRRFATLDGAARLNESEVADLWLAIGATSPTGTGNYAEAASDTFPADLVGLLVEPPIANVALSCLLAAYGNAFHADVPRGDGNVEAAQFLSERRQGPELRRVARDGWARFRNMVDRAHEVQHGTGWDDVDSIPIISSIPDHSEQMRVLKKVADLAGRMFKSLRGAKSKKVEGRSGEYHGIETSGAIERMTGQQMSALADDVSETLVWEAYTRRGLQTFRVRGPAKEGRGPLVIAIDESGSMDGDRRIWAKAAALAVTRSAHADNRPVAIVHWSTGAIVRHVKPGDVQAQVDAIMYYSGGGTNTSRALQVSKDAIADLASKGHRGADLILVTDGTDTRFDEKRAGMQALAADGTRTWTIGIEVAIPESDPIRELAAAYIPLDHEAMTNPDSLTSVVAAI